MEEYKKTKRGTKKKSGFQGKEFRQNDRQNGEGTQEGEVEEKIREKEGVLG